MRYRIIDEEVVESLIKFLDEIQFGTAEHGMKKSTVEIVNICSYFIEYHKSKSKDKSKDGKTKLKHFNNELKKDKDLTVNEKFELYYDEYLLNKQKQNSKGLNQILNDIGLTLENK